MMTSLTFLRLRGTLFLIAWLMTIIVAEEVEQIEYTPLVVIFVNEMPDESIELFWEDKVNGERKTEGTISPRGGFLDVHTFEGHEFSYDIYGARHYLSPKSQRNSPGDSFAILAGNIDSIQVRCKIDREKEMDEDLFSPYLDIMVKPYWAPRGASRFLELVREKYYDGVALNRVIPQFLTQFGIANDYDQRMEWDERPIIDDEPEERKFEPGFISFAGNEKDSRTTEIFIVMPDTSQEQLDYFGTNSWETPFALAGLSVEGSVLTRIYDGYGDMPPWGQGPDPDEIYDLDGYSTYLPEKFPKLDYIDHCFVLNEHDIGDLSVEL